MTDFCKVEQCQGDAVVNGYCTQHAFDRNELGPFLMPNSNGKIVPICQHIDTEPEQPVVVRHPVNYAYQGLNWNFIKLMAEIANYAADKYGSAEQYTNGRLEGQRSPLNHIAEHMRAYMARECHDHFEDLDHQLAAIAYNAMMEFHYLHHGGPTVPDVFYQGET